MELNCHGPENKKKIVLKYWLKPMAHLMLLHGQKKLDGCCGPLGTHYYIFLATPRDKTDTQEQVLVMGDHCAKEFLKLIKADPLPLINLFQQEPSIETNKSSGLSTGASKAPKLHPTNRILIMAVNVICSAWDEPPRAATLKIMDYTRSKPDTVNEKGIETLNKVIAKDGAKRSLTKIYEDIRLNNNLVEIDFTALHEYMISKGEASFYK